MIVNRYTRFLNRRTHQVCITPADHARAGMHPVTVCMMFQLSARELMCELCAYAGVNPPARRPGRTSTVPMWRIYFSNLNTLGLPGTRGKRRL